MSKYLLHIFEPIDKFNELKNYLHIYTPKQWSPVIVNELILVGNFQIEIDSGKILKNDKRITK